MTAENPAPGEVAPGNEAANHGAPAAVATPPESPTGDPKPAPPKQDPPKGGLPDDPAELHQMIRDLRSENANRRTAAKDAVESARSELAQTIGKALGLVEDEPIDPAKLTESLTASQAEAKQARVELAVFRAAGAAGGDPAALLDSSSFLKSLADVDPSDSTAITAAIEKAVESNPRLGAAVETRTPAPNPAQGNGASGHSAAAQLTQADLGRMTPEEIVAARRDGRLNKLMGVTT